MDNQPQQRFCTNCGQALAAGTACCVACGIPVNAPPAGAQGYAPPSVPALTSPAQTQDEFLMAALAAGLAAQQAGQTRQQGKRSRMG